MKYIIIGLGSYGGVLAEELTLLGHDVIGVDENMNNVDRIKDSISTSFVLDATDETALSILPLKSVDMVIVAIGENFGASIKVVALLKKVGVKHIYARAIDDVHKTVLDAFNLDNVLFPEKDAARSLVKSIDLSVETETFRIDKEYYIVKFQIPASFVGYKVGDLSMDKEFNIRIISLLKGRKVNNSIGLMVNESVVEETFEMEYKLTAKDYLVCYGKYKDFLSFWRAIN